MVVWGSYPYLYPDLKKKIFLFYSQGNTFTFYLLGVSNPDNTTLREIEMFCLVFFKLGVKNKTWRYNNNPSKLEGCVVGVVFFFFLNEAVSVEKRTWCSEKQVLYRFACYGFWFLKISIVHFLLVMMTGHADRMVVFMWNQVESSKAKLVEMNTITHKFMRCHSCRFETIL